LLSVAAPVVGSASVGDLKSGWRQRIMMLAATVIIAKTWPNLLTRFENVVADRVAKRPLNIAAERKNPEAVAAGT
jgi:hypothetical protein